MGVVYVYRGNAPRSISGISGYPILKTTPKEVRFLVMAAEVDSRFLCPICREVLKRPAIINICQHRYSVIYAFLFMPLNKTFAPHVCRFCEVCLFQIPPSESGYPVCPICRSPFSPQYNCCRDHSYETLIAHTDTTCLGCRQQV